MYFLIHCFPRSACGCYLADSVGYSLRVLGPDDDLLGGSDWFRLQGISLVQQVDVSIHRIHLGMKGRSSWRFSLFIKINFLLTDVILSALN